MEQSIESLFTIPFAKHTHWREFWLECSRGASRSNGRYSMYTRSEEYDIQFEMHPVYHGPRINGCYQMNGDIKSLAPSTRRVD